MATHSSILAWEIPWTEEPGGLQSHVLQRVRDDRSDLACTHTCVYICKHTYVYNSKYHHQEKSHIKIIKIIKSYFKTIKIIKNYQNY